MKSHELIRQLLQQANAKQLAAEMGLSTSLIYKWAEPGEDGGSGAQNPLDRVEQLARLTDGVRVAQWVCAGAGGFYVKSPRPLPNGEPHTLAAASHEIIHEFADMLSTIAAAALDNKITSAEAKDIRARWQALQSDTEEFVRSCEQGDFRPIIEKHEQAQKARAGSRSPLPSQPRE
jgi:hypothetical protein